MTSYQRYIKSFTEKVSKMTTKYGSVYNLLPDMLSEQQFNAQVRMQKLIYKKKGIKSTNYTRDIIQRQFQVDASADKILDYQNKLIDQYMEKHGVKRSTAKKALKDTLVTKLDIQRRTEKYRGFYKEVDNYYWFLKHSGMSGTEANEIIGQEYFGSP